MVPPESILGVIPAWPVVYLVAAIALALSAYWLYRRVFRLVFLGRPANRTDQPLKRLAKALAVFFSQSCVLRSVSWKDRAGIGHFFILWGFITFFLSYILFIFVESVNPGVLILLLGEGFLNGYGTFLNIMGLILLGVLVWAIVRRMVVKPFRLGMDLTQSADAPVVITLIGAIISFSFFSEGFYLASGVAGTVQGPVGRILAQLFVGLGLSSGAAEALHSVFWWAHFILIMGFAVYIPFSKHLHIVISPLTIFSHSLEAKGSLEPICDFRDAERYVNSRVQNFTWKELLDSYACAVCGRCTSSCPAYLSGKPLSPMHILNNIKSYLVEAGPQVLSRSSGNGANAQTLIGDAITEEVIWDCTTCGACEQECPVMIEHVDIIIELRRHLVEQRRLSSNTAQALENVHLFGNPWGYPQSARMNWAEGKIVNLIQQQEPVEILYWIGCAGAYEPRAQDISRAMLSILEKAGVSYAVLGTEEVCCGELARRIGEEGLFQMLAQSNIETIKKYNPGCILTHCPHCFNTLKNEYPHLGAHFQVVHHSQFILELIRTERIKLHEGQDRKLTFHDPCYLGRYNDIYAAPRQVLQSIPQVVTLEMEANKVRALCCGAGGGQMWIQSEGGKRIENMRFEQAQKVAPEVVATACPYCVTMLDVAASTARTGEKVRDIAELIAKAII